jgi:hypothetical protein
LRDSSAVSSCAASGLKNSRLSKSSPGRQAEEGVVGPGETVDAAVLAAPVGIDRAVEMDVRTAVAGDDGPGLVGQDHGRQLGGFGVLKRPAVVERFAGAILEPAGRVAARAAALHQGLGRCHGGIQHRAREQNKNY